MLRSRAWITKIPRQKYVPLLSVSSLTTVALTLQGVQASFIIFSRLNPKSTYNFGQGLPNVFIPLGCLGLMRLPAALWLSDDYGYLNVAETGSGGGHNVAETHVATMEGAGDRLLELDPLTSKSTNATVTRISSDTSHFFEPTTSTHTRLHPTHTPLARLYRFWWFVSVTGLLGCSAVSTSRMFWGYSRAFPYISLSHLLFDVMYFVITTATISITDTYILLGHTHSTLIPCIHATWYKVFTLVLVAMAVATVVVAALETRQLHDGSLSTLPGFYCNKTAVLCRPAAPGHGNFNT